MKIYYQLTESGGQNIARFDTKENALKWAKNEGLEDFDLIKCEVIEQFRVDPIKKIFDGMTKDEKREALTAACKAVKPKTWR